MLNLQKWPKKLILSTPWWTHLIYFFHNSTGAFCIRLRALSNDFNTELAWNNNILFNKLCWKKLYDFTPHLDKAAILLLKFTRPKKRKGKACFKRRATAVLSWLDCSSGLQHDISTTHARVSDVEFNSVEQNDCCRKQNTKIKTRFSTASLAVLHGSSTTWFQTSAALLPCLSRISSINWVRHGSSTTFERA